MAAFGKKADKFFSFSVLFRTFAKEKATVAETLKNR